MKRVLFIGVTKYNLEKDVHLRKKFEGLAQGIKPYVLARGKMALGRKLWGAEFFLLPRSVFWLVACKLAFWLCLAKKIDTIVVQGPLMEGLLGVALKVILRKELIVELHGDWGFRKNLSWIAPISLKNADKIRGVADYLIAKAKKISPQKPYFLFPTFTDLDDFLAETDVRLGNYILFVGRADKTKGINYLTEAFFKIEKDFPDFKLVMVGEGLPEGKLPLDKVREKMKHCYCLVVPSVSEGLPRVIMEAMALGKAIIASSVGGIPDLVKDGKTGFLVKPADSEALTQKMRILLQDKNLTMEMGKGGREFVVDRFSNEKYVRNYLEMINK